MSQLTALIKNDLTSLKAWFSKHTISKIVVAVVYLMVLALVGVGVYSWSDVFFNFLLEYRDYGELTIGYITRGAYVILIWLGVLSSFFVTVNFLFSPDKHTDYLLTLPVPDLLISLRSSSRSLLLNFFLLLISVFPLSLSLASAMAPELKMWNILGPVITLILILLISESLGSALGYIYAFLAVKKWRVLTSIVFGFIFLLATFLIVRMVFPSQLESLSDIPAESFNTFFANLPLIKDCRLAGTLIEVTTSPSVGLIYLIILALFLLAISVCVQSMLFLPIWQSAKVHLATHKKPAMTIRSLSRLSLISKDLLSIFRSPKDLGYLFFLLVMIVAFFGLFSRGYVLRGIPQRFHFDVLAFSFGWLIFLAGTYLLRFSFPLVVNEGQSRWWFFTLPVVPYRLVLSKVSTSLLLASPLFIIGLVQWFVLPFSISPVLLTLFSLLSLLFLATIAPLIGFMSPDFALAYNPDRASTSFTGLVSIVIVVATGVLGGYLISLSLNGGVEWAYAFNSLLGYVLVLSGVLWLVALNSLKKYTLDI